MKLRVPLLRELSMLAIGSGGMFRELFLLPPKDMSLVRVGICIVLMLGPTVALVWVRGRLTSIGSEPSSPSSASSSSSHP